MEAALSYSSATSSALLVMTGADRRTPSETFLSPIADPKVTLAGDPGGLRSTRHRRHGPLRRAPRGQRHLHEFVLRQHRAVARRRKGPGRQQRVDRARARSCVVCTRHARWRADGSVTLPAGAASSITTNSPADYHLQLLKSELKSLTLVGTATTNAPAHRRRRAICDRESVRPGMDRHQTRLSAPGMYTITFTARAVRRSTASSIGTTPSSPPPPAPPSLCPEHLTT